jgi:exodeoxyribonuclease V beta subunit
MPRGALAGSCLHAIYEEADFRQEDQEKLRGLVALKLLAFGFEPALLADSVARSVSDSLDTELLPGEPGFTLRSLPCERRLNELEFLFPVARGESSGHGSATDIVSPQGLARVFESCGGESIDCYGEALARLAFSPFKGFMKGFIDLVFEHQGRYYLLDYKSNHLGDEWEDYGPERLARVMADHHYILQYHLYTVALHRYLGFRLRGYDYDEHFGGAGYVFLRGLSPETGTERGVYFHRPERRLVEALSSYLERGE